MIRTIATLLAVTAIALAGAAGAGAQATTFTTNEEFPFATVVFVPCANDGAGELVELTGTLHVLSHITIDDQGGRHGKFHFQPQGVSGVGLTTGDTYRGTGVSQSQFNATAAFEQTFINNFRIIGQGPDNNFLVHSTSHVTENANGELTAVVGNFSTECQ